MRAEQNWRKGVWVGWEVGGEGGGVAFEPTRSTQNAIATELNAAFVLVLGLLGSFMASFGAAWGPVLS